MPQQRVVGLIGCPGAGKTTYARRFNPLDGWVQLTLDDFREAMWPPHRKVYWRVRQGRFDRQAEQLLHRAKEAALETALAMGFNVIMADTHLTAAVFARELAVVASYGITIEWKLLDVPWEVLQARNRERRAADSMHCQPDHVMQLAYDAFHAPDAWWRSLPRTQLEIIKA